MQKWRHGWIKEIRPKVQRGKKTNADLEFKNLELEDARHTYLCAVGFRTCLHWANKIRRLMREIQQLEEDLK